MTPISRRRVNESSLAALCWLVVAASQVAFQVAQTVQVHDQQRNSSVAKPNRLELKFQSELDNSKIIKHLGQQQVFKCQVRLAPAGVGLQYARARLKSSSITLTGEETTNSTYANSNSSIWDGADLAPAFHPLKFNVTQLTIEWLKNGRPLDMSSRGDGGGGGVGGGDEISVVNVTLKTQHQQQQSRTFDKMMRGQALKPRVEIKNTLNGRQLKLTSRLRISQMREDDSGLFQCVARARFILLDSDSKGERFEQSLESANAHLIVWPSAPGNHSIEPSKSGDNGRPRLFQPGDALAKAIKQPAQQQVSHSSSGLNLQSNFDLQTPTSDDEKPPQFELQTGQNGRPTSKTTTTTSLFEDDEDLFKLDPGDLISGGQRTNDNEQEQQIIALDTTNNDLNGLLVGVERQKSQQQQHAEAHLDWILDVGAGGEDEATSDNDDQSGLSSQPTPLSRRRPHSDGYHKIDDRARQQEWDGLVSGVEQSVDSSTLLVPKIHSRANGASAAAPFDHHRPADGVGDSYPSGKQWTSSDASKYTQDSARSKLATLVHKIVPESSCYTGAGELYRGSAAHSGDQRECLNWLQVRASLAARAWGDAAASGLKIPQQQLQQQQEKQVLENQTTTTTTTDYISASSLSSALSTTIDDHNYCRNPNGDPRGPWCFVAYSQSLDGVILTPQFPSIQRRVITHRQQVVRVGRSGEVANAPPLMVVVSPCAQIVSCSEYLWLYVVAPPLGLLFLLTCLASLTIRSIQKSRGNSIFSTEAYRHQPLKCASNLPCGAGALSLGLSKLFASRRPSRKRLVQRGAEQSLCSGLSKKSTRGQHQAAHATRKSSSYLNDDIFEIVDEMDWSDGQKATAVGVGVTSEASTMSPKSSESSCQSSSSSPRSRTRANTDEVLLDDWQAQMAHSKSTNPVYSEQALDLQLSQRQATDLVARLGNSRGGSQNKMSKSRSQAGPMFATLRCQVRNSHQRRLAADSSGGNGKPSGELLPLQPQAKKSSSFIEHQHQHQHQYSNGEMHQNKHRGANCEWVQPGSFAVGNSSSFHSDLSSTRTGHLISCAASSCGSNGSNNALASNSHNNDMPARDSESLALVSELPRLEASSITLAYDTEAIFEGEFCQVLRAYHKQNELDLTQATGRIGAQVAVCSLKQQAAIDESIFYASELRVHNLNHLNILKLMGYVQSSKHTEGMPQLPTSGIGRAECSLVYDMAHLIDLSDWLREQCKDAIVAQDDEISGDLSLRQNLTCIAKQVALALDYLHDKNIVYKDLACRNCFLDVTRMLVKLASFNVETEFVSQEESPAFGHSGVPGPGSSNNSEDNNRQKELLSKKLSLKSMVRPKYLLDYYVIDSRPSECQLLALSWIPLESILFNKFNKQTDIWSFGCLLYELFSLGAVAHFGYSSKQVIDSVRSNMMPPQPLLCPNGIYKLMCKCLSDIPTLRPNIKHVYEKLNMYSGQCSSFLNHHLCII